jgi:hypothetical protein
MPAASHAGCKPCRLQARIRMLNDELKSKFRTWYPGFEGLQPARPAACKAKKLKN